VNPPVKTPRRSATYQSDIEMSHSKAGFAGRRNTATRQVTHAPVRPCTHALSMRADPLRMVAHAHDGRAACGEAATRRCATQSLSAQTDRAFGGAHPVCGSPPAPTACAVQLLRPSPASSSTGVVHSVRPRTVPPSRVQSAPSPRRATRRSARRSRETYFVPGHPAGPPSVFDGYGSPASERPVSSVCRPGRPGLSLFRSRASGGSYVLSRTVDTLRLKAPLFNSGAGRFFAGAQNGMSRSTGGTRVIPSGAKDLSYSIINVRLKRAPSFNS